jgi:hypothetical protein
VSEALRKAVENIEALSKRESTMDELFAAFQSFRGLPYCLIKLNKGRAIYRARFSDEKTLYTDASAFSYRKDLPNIKGYGRANLPGQSVFYGSLASGEIEEGYITSVFETSGNLRNDVDGVEHFSFSKWELKEEIEAICILTEKSSVVGQFKEMYEGYMAYMKKQESHDLFKRFFSMLENEYSKRVKSGSSDEYMLSAVFTSYVFKGSAHPIVYPSVQAGSKGLNIVLDTSKVDQHLRLKTVIAGELHKQGENSVISQTDMAEVTNEGVIDYKELGAPYRLSKEQIETQLK